MNINISTNIYKPHQLEEIFNLLEKSNDSNIGLELFVEWQDEMFEEIIKKNMDKFKKYNISMHGPYYNTEHSAPKGTSEYEISLEFFKKSLQLSKELNSKYIVYHHNNCMVMPENKEKMIAVSGENLIELSKIAEEYGAHIVVENSGVKSHDNMLFNEEEFINMAENIKENILIDIGHAFANDWNLERVIKKLKDKIIAYHIHNNNGWKDNHDRIRNGMLNFKEFLEIYKKHTPKADLVIEYGKQCYGDDEGIIDDINYIKNCLN